MKNRNLFKVFFLFIFLMPQYVFSQNSIEVADMTFKVDRLGGKKEFYYGFAEGDQILFNFEEVNGKELKEIEVVEMPSSIRYKEFKASYIKDKSFTVSKNGVYMFKILNSAINDRMCKVKIERIPSLDGPKKFNTSVFWKTVNDTSFYTVYEDYIINSDTSILNLTDQVAKVHSSSNLNGNKTTLNFLLPNNTIAWSYYIGVDQAGQQAFDNACRKLAANASPFLLKIPSYGPLAALALGGVSFLSSVQNGEDINYYIVDDYNLSLCSAGRQFNCLKNGKVVNDYSRMILPLRGSYSFVLFNDNAIDGVNVSVKITAVVVNQDWGKRPIVKYKITSRQEPFLNN